MERIQPFLKWAGGKFKLIDKITRQFPNTYRRRYIEPFVGAGAVAINVVDFPTIIINDNNADLTNVWYCIRMFPHELVKECETLFSGKYNDANLYYGIREQFNAKKATLVQLAAMFIYLNKHGFNGLCRYNASGGFNVPFGKYAGPKFDAQKILDLSKRMSGWLILNQDFRVTLQMAGEGDVVYCDPPYVSDKDVENGFTSYTAGGFTLKDQIELAIECRKACERGAHVILSNHDTELTQNLYLANGADIVRFEVQRNISCDGKNRKKAGELLAVFTPQRLQETIDKMRKTDIVVV